MEVICKDNLQNKNGICKRDQHSCTRWLCENQITLQTNYEKIHNMSIDEMAEFLEEIYFNGYKDRYPEGGFINYLKHVEQ